MAYADYRLCDVCGGKAFYDSNLNYESTTDQLRHYRQAGEKVAGDMCLDRVGDWAVLCLECAKIYSTKIVQRT